MRSVLLGKSGKVLPLFIAVTIAMAVALCTTPFTAAAEDAAPPTPKLEHTVSLSSNIDIIATDGRHLVGEDSDAGKLLFVDLTDERTTASVDLCQSCTVTPGKDSNTVYMFDERTGALTAYDARTGAASDLGTIPMPTSLEVFGSPTLTGDGRSLIVKYANNGDTTSNTPISTFSFSAYDVTSRKVSVSSRQYEGTADDMLVSNDLTTIFTVENQDGQSTFSSIDVASGKVNYSTQYTDPMGASLYFEQQFDNGTILLLNDYSTLTADPETGEIHSLFNTINVYFGFNADCSIATFFLSDNAFSQALDSPEDYKYLVTVDLASGDRIASIAAPANLFYNAYGQGQAPPTHNTASGFRTQGWLSTDGNYLYLLKRHDESNALETYDLQTGQITEVALPDGVKPKLLSSSMMLTDDDTKLVAYLPATDGNGGRILVYSTGIMSAAAKHRRLILISGIAGAVCIVLIIVVTLIVILRRRRQRKQSTPAMPPAVPLPSQSSPASAPASASAAPPAATPATIRPRF